MNPKSYSEMTPGDYAALGFKSGLEIHQQLLTEKKLFCRCPAGRYSPQFNAEILRHMRPTLSELGEYDGTALMEFKTRKEIIYRIHRESVCTYEMDDTPPFELNSEALDIALEIGLQFGCTMVDEIHIARKQYLDGSIPTGFQRTTIVGVDGGIPYRGRTIGIVQLGLEEDSCREVSDIGHRRTYLTDRLGMPLVETVTAPDMRTPLEAAEVAEILRHWVRTTGKVRTGAGAARQDVNVSIAGGTRIEIKGVPRIANIPLLLYNEALRQHALLELREELLHRGVTKETFEAKTEEVTKLLKTTRYQPLSGSATGEFAIYGVLLRGFAGLLRWQTQSDTLFSREISDRVRVIACLTALPNIVHSDSPGETLASSEWQMLRKALTATSDDAIVLVWGPKNDALTGASEIVIRAREATFGVPSETRQALRDGTNGFERILPGPDRMYPDTDLPPRQISEEHLQSVRQRLQQPFWEREAWYRELHLPEDLIRPLAVSRLAGVFERAYRKWKAPPTLAAVILLQFPKRVERKTGKKLSHDRLPWDTIFQALGAGRLAKEGVLPLLERAVAGEALSPDSLPDPCSREELLQVIQGARAKLAQAKVRHPDQMHQILMGQVMERVRGRVDGSLVTRLVSSTRGRLADG